MSIDDFSYPNEESSQDKKKKKLEKQRQEEFLREQAVLRETNSLLQKLAQELSENYGISLSEAKKALESGTNLNLSNLSQNLEHKLSEEKLQSLLGDIAKAQESIQDTSKSLRERLKSSLDEAFHPDQNSTPLLTRKLPKSFVKRAQEPQNLYDNLLGASIGTIDSGEAVVLMGYELGRGIILSPYHLYLLLSGKARVSGRGKI